MKELRFPDSLGLLYTAVTTYLGFKTLEGEGKIMGLAGHGKLRFLEQFKAMIPVHEDGSFRLDRKYFPFTRGNRMYGRAMVELLGPVRLGHEPIEERHCDVAATLQRFVEDIIVRQARHLHGLTGLDSICLAGGTYLNCVANGRILEDTPFKKIFVQPAAGDSGGALGAAAYLTHCVKGQPRVHVMRDAYLGPGYTAAQAKRALVNTGLAFTEYDENTLGPAVAQLLAKGKIVGWFQGRIEFGPRALGNRSILADPRDPTMKDTINLRIKHREPFRPFAPVVIEERANEYFEARYESPFMSLSVPVRQEFRAALPAITHVDGSARLQTLAKDANPRLYRLIEAFNALTGVPVLLNTSFNLQGEPIVCEPQEAVDSYLRGGLDVLVMDTMVVERNKQA
jgi:carbamoyltransferase